ncbi:MAG: hypothetical protein OQK04_06390, partial [Kangiellaceae bacterium]|nr:hypothetical protein [Kangiellaceae bacterium]
IIIGFLFVFFIFAQAGLALGPAPEERVFRAVIMINLVMSTFLGVYFAGAQLSLKQFYLWKVNPRFRTTLMLAFLILVGSSTLLITIAFAFNINQRWLFLILPFCASIFAAQLVLETTLVKRTLAVIIPIGISQLQWLEIHEAFYLIPIFMIAMFYIRRMYSPSYFRQTGYMDIMSINKAQLTNSKPKIIIAANHYLGEFVSRWILKSKAVIDWAITMPHSKLALITSIWLFTLIPFFLIVGGGKPELLESFVFMFTASVSISMAMESRLQFFQLKSFAHIFSGQNHRELKNKILRSVDKTILVNCLVLLVGSMALAYLLDEKLDYYLLFSISMMIISVSLVFSPVLLCLTWIKVTFSQVSVLVLYGASLFAIAKLMAHFQEQLGHSVIIFVVIAFAFICRQLTQRVFWVKPLEQLLRNV